MSDSYECGEVVLCNNLKGSDSIGYGVIVTGNTSFGSLMVYQFININDRADVISRNAGSFINVLRLMHDNKRFNIFKEKDKAIFIDVEQFFNIDNIEFKSYATEANAGRVVKLSKITRDEVLIPNGVVLCDQFAQEHEIVACRDKNIITMLDDGDSVYEHSMKNLFTEFKKDPIIDMINKLWPSAGVSGRSRGVLSRAALKNSIKTRR